MDRRQGRYRRDVVSVNEAVSLRALRRQLRIDVDGRKYTPSRTPRPITAVPWNSIVLTEQSDSPTSVTSSVTYNSYAVYVLLSYQLGLTSLSPSLEMRFEKVEMWNYGPGEGAPGAAAAIIMDVFSLGYVPSGQATIATCEDEAGKNQWACVGYEWPRSHRNVSFAITSGTAPTADVNVCRYYSSVAASRVWVRFHLLWRPVVALPPSLLRRIDQLAV